MAHADFALLDAYMFWDPQQGEVELSTAAGSLNGRPVLLLIGILVPLSGLFYFAIQALNRPALAQQTEEKPSQTDSKRSIQRKAQRAPADEPRPSLCALIQLVCQMLPLI